MKTLFAPFWFLLCGLFACNRPTETPAGPAPAVPAPAADLSRFLLAAAPAPAQTVLEAKQQGAKDHTVVHGRIANLVKGYAAFTLMDESLPYCGESNPEDKCKTPWDYCCEKATTRSQHALVVELRAPDGKVLPAPALPELRLLDVVTVVGHLEVDAAGNSVLVASGYHRQTRPVVPDYVRWPQ
jgi:hypothetical protein